MSPPRIDAARLLRDLDELARIGGRPDGGVTRLAFSAEDRRGRDLVERLLGEIGVTCRFDAVGNLVGIRESSDPDAPIVLTGSHTDTVADGGRFDGALGVLSGLAVLRTLAESGARTGLGVGVVSFVNEEGVRFLPDMMGSQFVRGDLDLSEARAAAGIDGVRLGEELDRHGMGGSADFGALDVKAFVELHVEQGPVLEDAGEPVGVVTGVQGLRWLRVQIEGTSNHAGTTPMTGRRDAGLVVARIVSGVRALTATTPDLRATCGRVVLEPNLVNVIPRAAQLTVDLRHPYADRLAEADAAVRSLVAREATAEGAEATVEPLAHAPPVTFDPRVVTSIERAAATPGLPCRRMLSGASHDAQIMSAVWPTAMIFVRSRNGVSHSPDEWSSPDDIAAGAELLLRTILDLAG